MKKTKKYIYGLVLCIVYIFGMFTSFASASDDQIALLAVKTDGSEDGKRIEISSRIFETIFGSEKGNSKKESEKPLKLIACGDVFGIKIEEDRPSVARIQKNSELQVGDKILSLDGVEIYSIDEVKAIIKDCKGDKVDATVLRDGKRESLSLSTFEKEGETTLGVELKQSAVGIGTITYINPETNDFGGLGHAVTDTRGGITTVKRGIATSVVLTGVNRGESGKAGEICGVLGRGVIGRINANSECGVFGNLICDKLDTDEAIPVGARTEVKSGKAEIISTLKSGKKAHYEIEISDIDYGSKGSKSFKIKVTDEALIAISGGIVRGMSGSPIIQDGKLIGAVTHVMVADPTEGYGIFIENMLNASEIARNELPAA